MTAQSQMGSRRTTTSAVQRQEDLICQMFNRITSPAADHIAKSQSRKQGALTLIPHTKAHRAKENTRPKGPRVSEVF
jgi:hypothetical protein